jgi:hypothetical protein
MLNIRIYVYNANDQKCLAAPSYVLGPQLDSESISIWSLGLCRQCHSSSHVRLDGHGLARRGSEGLVDDHIYVDATSQYQIGVCNLHRVRGIEAEDQRPRLTGGARLFKRGRKYGQLDLQSLQR